MTIYLPISAVISGITFVIGLLVGMLLNKCAIRLQTRNKRVHVTPPDPTHTPEYAEVPIKAPGEELMPRLVNYKVNDNVAYYGPL